jgi:FkbM family methyltransferase
MFALKEEEVRVNCTVQQKFLLRLNLFLQNIPRLRKIVFSHHNPFYVYHKGKKQLKSVPENNMQFYNSVWAINFVRYCMENTIHFDTGDFFPKEDNGLIQRHIDYRIKSFLRCSAEAMDEEQLNCLYIIQDMNRNVKKRGDFYVLLSDNKKYYLPQKKFEVNSWGYHYGLKQLPDKIKEYIIDKDFLDIGAFIGDSALMFLQYQPKRIFAYEPVSDSYQDLIKTIEQANTTKIHAINKGIGDKETFMRIAVNGIGSTILNNCNINNTLPTEEIGITTIDTECKNKKIGLVKIDIEGFEYFAIRGGLETIKRDKPVLLISIYHTGKDFFEIPPMIKSCVPEYAFRYLDIMPSSSIDEKILVGYINQLS